METSAARAKKTRYSEHIDARLTAMREAGRKVVDIANLALAQPPELFQWRTGLRPVPWQRARQLAAALETQPELISEQFAEIASGAAASGVAEPPAAYVSQPERPAKDILLETVQIAVELLLKKQSPLTEDDVMSCYEQAVRRRAARVRAIARATQDESHSGRSTGTGSDHPRAKRIRSK